MLLASAVILAWPEGIARVFTSDPALVAETGTFLRIAVAGYSFLGLMSVLMNALSGAGDTLPPMLVSVAVLLAVTIPLAFTLPQVAGLGVLGVRWAMVSGMAVPGIILAAYFRMGRWKAKTV